MQEQYEAMTHKLETGTSLKPGKKRVKLEPIENGNGHGYGYGESKKKQRTDKEFDVMQRLEALSLSQLLNINKKVAHLIEEKYFMQPQ